MLANPHLAECVRASYGGGFVDEYQDCTTIQHQVSLALGELMPLRVLGDPLQGIFGFAGEAICWSRDVASTFATFDVETHPWRWASSNAELGQWLLELRQSLLTGQVIDLTTGPIAWAGKPIQNNQVTRCQRAATASNASVVAILRWPSECHKFSKSLRGRFSSMDELEGKDFLHMAEELDRAATGHEKAAVLLEAARGCFTRLPPTVRAMIQNLNNSKLPSINSKTANVALVEAIRSVVEAPTPTNLLVAAKQIEAIPDVFAHRSELWMAIKRGITVQRDDDLGTNREAAVVVRDRTRERGRAAELRTVSRTLLVKGLEYDHAVILNGGALSAKEFYVAATRGRQTLTIFSDKPQLQFAVPEL